MRYATRDARVMRRASVAVSGAAAAQGVKTRRGYCGQAVAAATPNARASIDSPIITTIAPIARATRSPFGATRSAVIAAVTAAIARRSIMPTARRAAVKPAQQQAQ